MKINLLAILSCALALHAQAGSATWKLDPADSNWQNAANWDPAVVPNGASDVATFGVSHQLAVVVGTDITVGQITFSPGASAYSIAAAAGKTFTFKGAGMVNNSGLTQNFNLQASAAGLYGVFIFLNSASAGGSDNLYTCEGGRKVFDFGGTIQFCGTSTAGQASFVANGGTVSAAFGGAVVFIEDSSEAEGIFTGFGGAVSGAFGGVLIFGGAGGNSTGGNATVIAYGASFANAGGTSVCYRREEAQVAPLVMAYGGTNGGFGGDISLDDIPGFLAQIHVFGNAMLDSSNSCDAEIGSLEGDGIVEVGDFNLTIGGNDFSTRFSGVIQNRVTEGGGGTITKIGTGTLRLTGASIYQRGTTLAGGSLIVENARGSATGSGDVAVPTGTLGGKGIISGFVTVGSSANSGAILAPSAGASQPHVLTIQKSLTFKADGSYTWKVDTKKARADQISAGGVTIESGALFNLQTVANRRLTAGQVFTVINNTAATPIDGTFLNLPEAAIVTVGSNTFQASYTGGVGNDLTLTVAP